MAERKKKVEQPGCPNGTPHHHWRISTERDSENRSPGTCRNCGAERMFWNGWDYEAPEAYRQYANVEARVTKGRRGAPMDETQRGLDD